MGFAVALGFAGVLSYFLTVQDWGNVSPGNGPREVQTFGENLLGVGGAPQIFALLFQVAAVLLFVAIVAAIVISRRHDTGEGES
jgi:NADH:ubiquinone oxidoreductase subunit 6 (subunit J)